MNKERMEFDKRIGLPNGIDLNKVRTKTKELSSKSDVIKSVCSAKIPCTCERAFKASGFIDCDNSCK